MLLRRVSVLTCLPQKRSTDYEIVKWFATAVSALLFTLTIVAFLMVGLVVVAYVGPVGWVAVAFTIFFALLGYGCMIWQSPLEWPRWLVRAEGEEQDAFEKHLQRSETERQRASSGDGLTRLPTRQPSRQRPPDRDDRSRDYGRSTSGDYAGGSRRYTRRDGGDNTSRYSRAVVTEVNEPGIFGHGGMFKYDDGVREGLVMSRYD